MSTTHKAPPEVRITELEREAAILTIQLTSTMESYHICQDHIRQKDKRIESLCSILKDSMAVMDRYINVPEAAEIKKRWEALKGK